MLNGFSKSVLIIPAQTGYGSFICSYVGDVNYLM